MKVKTISRNPTDTTRERAQDLFKLPRNLDATLHPFQRAREYVRALNSTKVSRMLAKPFVANLAGHIDGVYAMERHPTVLTTLFSASADGELRQWDLSTREAVWKAPNAHQGTISGIAPCPFSNVLVSVGSDKAVHLWDSTTGSSEPTARMAHSHALTGVSHHRRQNLFATSSPTVDLWDHERTEPVHSFRFGDETVTAVSFNQAEPDVLATCGSERTIALFDTRARSALAKVTLALRSNAVRWNPMEPFHFAVANEDHCAYVFDMRNLKRARNVYRDHVGAVLDVDFAPTGREIVTGSYDKTIRIFDVRAGHSREIYHTSRMQHVQCVRFSMDARFVLSGSDDGNVRVWRADASERLAPKSARQRDALQYQQQLQKKFQHMPEIRRIARQRHVPKAVTSARNRKHTIVSAARRREQNAREHSAPGAVPFKSEREKMVVGVE